MRVAIAGAHGKIALALARRLLDDGDEVLGLIRNPDHAAELREIGVQPVVCDLEQAEVPEITEAVRGADAAVFAAGAGPGSGAERKLTMDRDGAIKLLRAASGAGVRRYVIVSAVGAEDPPSGDEVFAVYLRAKAQADDAVRASQLEWTIVRPGGLTDDPGTELLAVGTEPFRGEVPREDVAALIEFVLHQPVAVGATLYVNSGQDPVEQAVRQALGSST